MVGCRKSLASLLPGRQGPCAECYPAYRYAIRCDGIASMWFACRRVRTIQADVVQPGTWPDVLAGTIDPVTSHRTPGKTAHEGAGCRCGRNARQDTRHRAAGA